MYSRWAAATLMEVHGTDARTSHRRLLPALTVAAAMAVAAVVNAQPARFDDVVRNLRNPDPEVRLSAVRLLREAKYPEAIVPLAALINDPIDGIQLEAMSTELSFFVTTEIPTKRKLAFVIERRASNRASRAFDMGPFVPMANRPPAELVKGLLNAVDDENGDGRLDLVFFFRTQDLNLTVNSTAATLMAHGSYNGADLHIEGTDSVRVIP